MYAGRKVEEAPVDELFARPQHPYTHGLMASIPRLDLMRGEEAGASGRLQEIPGMVPALSLIHISIRRTGFGTICGSIACLRPRWAFARPRWSCG